MKIELVAFSLLIIISFSTSAMAFRVCGGLIKKGDSKIQVLASIDACATTKLYHSDKATKIYRHNNTTKIYYNDKMNKIYHNDKIIEESSEILYIENLEGATTVVYPVTIIRGKVDRIGDYTRIQPK